MVRNTAFCLQLSLLYITDRHDSQLICSIHENLSFASPLILAVESGPLTQASAR